ncbi:hypothetical protein IV203_011738 [Nitzschia inconspicua]|uniref:Uncharacterized protein n=1 Tax=Nitzschia inconspicua TaxID=303405 RepID=A0A9K3KTB7_9STRA|nr:hypothetical protein IV203_011738 [Nitzschia inconspicua]
MDRVSFMTSAMILVVVGSFAIINHCEGFQPDRNRCCCYSQAQSSTKGLYMRQSFDRDEIPTAFFYQDGDRNSNDSPNAFPLGSSTSYNEYDRDAEFYRRRNQEYYKSLQNMQQQDTYSFNELTGGGNNNNNNNNNDSQKLSSQRHLPSNPEAQKMAENTINSVLKSSRSSFKNIEKITFRLLNRRPLVALGIFLATGALIAYMTGFFILEGYIDNLNPAENDQVPYWDEPEIHTIMRKY